MTPGGGGAPCRPPWTGRLRVVGIGLEGAASMSPRGRRLVDAAHTVVGSRRHLALLAPDRSDRIQWDGNVNALETVLEGRTGSTTVLVASGDPNLFGIGASLLARYGPDAVDVEPSVSSFQLAVARAGIPAAGVVLLSAHGRSLSRAVGPALAARRAAILTDPEHHPGVVIDALAAAGMEGSARVIVAERLGADAERLREGIIVNPPSPPYDPLSILVLDRAAAFGPGVGVDESTYEHQDGLVTKAEVRAVAIACLDPARDDVVWDLGAGSGSVAIEAGRLAEHGMVYAVERDPDRAGLLRRNLARHGSWNVETIEGDAIGVIPALPSPDAVFVGGSGGALACLIESCVAAIRRRSAAVPGRLVANLATLDSVLEAIEACRRAGVAWRLSQVQVSRGREIGGRIRWEALNPVHVLAAQVNRS